MAVPWRTSAASLGSRGGRAGRGASKRRGDSEYYRRLAAKRKDRCGATTGMRHRHLTHHDLTLAAIDDIITNGRLQDWERLRASVRAEPGIRAKVVRVCDARGSDPTDQRHDFWRRYATEASAGT